jgi:PRTRC genetic system protein A
VAGYLVNHPGHLQGERGLAYDYVLAGNGLFIEAEGKLLAARIPVAPGPVRGLADLEPLVVLRYGKIPGRLLELAVNVMLADPGKERYVAVTWEDGYRIRVPDQEREPGKVEYSVIDNTMLDLHSHCAMRARFSGQDDKDEQGFQLYGVIGRMDRRPEIALRMGVYGYFYSIEPSDIFEGNMESWCGEKEDELQVTEN